MGESIARENLRAGLSVLLYDSSFESLSRCAERLRATGGELRLTSSLEELEAADLIIEAIPEQAGMKKRLYKQLTLAPHGLLATNTSSLSIQQLAQGLAWPDRFAGLHFCHPVPDRPLVEVIPGPATSAETLQHLQEYVRSLGKTPLHVGDCPGFVVNRLLTPYLAAAVRLVEQGVEVHAIETAATVTGMPWGPLTQLDEIGIDVGLRVGQNLRSDQSAPPELLLEMYVAGLLGRKTGTGFFEYPLPAGTTVGQPLSAAVRERLAARGVNRVVLPQEELRRLIFSPVQSEGQQILREGVVTEASQLELAFREGLGYTGLPLFAELA